MVRSIFFGLSFSLNMGKTSLQNCKTAIQSHTGHITKLKKDIENKAQKRQIKRTPEVRTFQVAGVAGNNSYKYSGGRMKFNSSKGFNFSGYTKSIKTCNIPLKRPIKWLPRMQKKI